MFLSDGRRKFPYLSEYLIHAAKARSLARPSFDVGSGLIGALGASVFTGLITNLLAHGNWAAGLFSGGCVLVLGAGSAVQIARLSAKPKPMEEDVRLERDSRLVVKKLEALMNRRRLHRDLGEDVSSLLETAAMDWSRARSALMSPYWNRSDLAEGIRRLREQSLQALERGMQELLVLYSSSVPDQPSSWNLAEVVDEVVGKDILSGRPHRRLSVFHESAVEIVMRLRELADETERLSRELIADPTGPDTVGASQLEATLAELRSLRQAEEELRQDVSS